MKKTKTKYGYKLEFTNIEGKPVVSKFRKYKRAKKEKFALARIHVGSSIKKYKVKKKGSAISKGVKKSLKKWGWG